MGKRRAKYVALTCMVILALTACDSGKKEQHGEGGGEKIEKDIETVKREVRLAGNFTDQSYPYCNSTNLYKMPYHEQAEDDGISLIQYDLKGNHRREIKLHEKEKDAWENLISVDDQWIYYEYYSNSRPAVCRMPITKKDGRDYIDTSAEEVLLYPEKRTKEEKAQGMVEKEVFCDYWVTSEYLLYFVSLDYKDADDYVNELVRYDLKTGEVITKRFDGMEEPDSETEASICADGSRIVYRVDGAINVLDVEAMEIRALASYDPSSYAVSPDGSLLVCGQDNYEYKDKDPARIYFYSLDKGNFLAVISSHEIKGAICQAEGMEGEDVFRIYNHVLGCYGDKAYMRYQVEYGRDGKRMAHYGVISMTLSEEPKLRYEQGISEAVRQESVEYEGQWRRYHKYIKKEKARAKKTGVKLKKKLDKAYGVSANLGNPQRVIGNQLFCRSVNVDMNRNHWFCINLDTGERERIDGTDSRYQWIYCESMAGWTFYDGNYFSDNFQFLEGSGRTEVVWEQGEEGHSEKTTQKKVGKADSRDAVTIQEQLRYLAEHRYDWLGAIVEGNEGYDEIPWGERFACSNYNGGLFYMVSDLDQDGQLEVVMTDMAGTGRFTRINAYEFSERTHRLEALDIKDVGPDIGGLGKTTVYYDAKRNQYLYYGEDFVHGSAYDNWRNICLWSVSRKGKFLSYYYGRTGMEKGDRGLQYYLDDKKVTKKVFARKEKNMEPGMERGKATFGWQQDRKNLLEMGNEELLQRLSKSWKGFCYYSRSK